VISVGDTASLLRGTDGRVNVVAGEALSDHKEGERAKTGQKMSVPKTERKRKERRKNE
jgi:hypothetical protein